MSYDVVVTETTGEISVETKFKNYKDYIDYTERKDGVENISTNITDTESTTEGRSLITRDNWREILKVGDTVVFKEIDDETKENGIVVNNFYTISELDTEKGYNGSLPFELDNLYHWPDITHNKIYKIL